MADFAHLFRLGVVKRYAADEVFFQQGDPGSVMYIILTGRVVVLSRNIDGSFVPVAQLNAGDFFGEMSLLEKQPRSASVLALEQTVVIELSEDNFSLVISRNPEFAFRIMKGLSNRVRRLTEELVKGSNDIEENEAEGNEPVIVEKPVEPMGEVETVTFFDDVEPRNYPLTAPATDKEYLFEKQICCPICEKEFPVNMIRSSKLKLKGITPDLRQSYEDFDPLWYMVWACPHCGYANFYYQFKQVNELMKKSILHELKSDNPVDYEIKFSYPRKINEVFKTFHLCYRTFTLGKSGSEDMAKLWLRLSWLYQDVGDEELYIRASRSSLERYLDTFLNTRSTSAEQDSRLCLLLGELNFRLNNNEEALKFFRKAINRKNGSPNINRQAEDRINDVIKKTRSNNTEEEKNE